MQSLYATLYDVLQYMPLRAYTAASSRCTVLMLCSMARVVTELDRVVLCFAVLLEFGINTVIWCVLVCALILVLDYSAGAATVEFWYCNVHVMLHCWGGSELLVVAYRSVDTVLFVLCSVELCMCSSLVWWRDGLYR